MTDYLEQKIKEKRDAIRSDAFLAKKQFDNEKGAFEDIDANDNFDDYIPEVAALRHEIKLIIGLLEESKFDEVVHLISNPIRLMGINLIIGLFRGLGFAIALIIIGLLILTSFYDVVFIG